MAALRFSTSDPQKVSGKRTACAILPVGSALKLNDAGRALAKDSAGVLGAALKAGEFNGAVGETQLLHCPGMAQRILLVGVGDGKLGKDDYLKMSRSLARALLASKAGDAQMHLGALKVNNGDWDWLCQRLATDLVYHGYRYALTLSKPKEAPTLNRFALLCADSALSRRAKSALKRGADAGAGINLARELANTPANYCTPEHLAKEARRLARGHEKASCKVLNEKAMADLGMHSLLSVTAGTATPAKLIVMEYNGGKRGDAPHVLVGKGITFDSGGISLKPGAKMDEMKFDMGGAASVLGTMQAVMAMGLPLNIVAIIAAAENMPSGTATKPGDVVTSMAGITIEILNTDAEGRLVLCDALTYAERFKPASVVDIATLTGACVVALGSHASGLYANDESLAAQLLDAGTTSHDRAWRMPLWDDYQRQLDSNFADMGNIGGPGGGSVTAACFLSRFATKYQWAHLDIAGSAWDSAPKGATGRPVGLLTQYLCDRAAGG
ncbi:leucyl aminopeptidase [Congregibacter sp.]|uniref:leucyl aminopeptidase n=1 Tax=Congregibacter sp. TaxID=2744308 RepID=UPI003F6C019B